MVTVVEARIKNMSILMMKNTVFFVDQVHTVLALKVHTGSISTGVVLTNVFIVVLNQQGTVQKAHMVNMKNDGLGLVKLNTFVMWWLAQPLCVVRVELVD